MKKINKMRIKILGLFLFLGVFTMLGLSSVKAQSFNTGDNVTFSKDKKIDQTIYAAGTNIDIASEVVGDVFCAGQTVNISGYVHGDIICAGQTVNITGKVDGDVRIAGQTVSLDNTVAGNASIGSQAFTLGSKGKIGGDASVVSSSAILNGTIGRDLAIGSGTVTVNNSVGRDIKATATKIELTSDARVKGSVAYTSQNQIVKQSGAVVGGNVNQTVPEQKTKQKNGAVFGMVLGWIVYILVSLSIVSLTLAILYPSLLPAVTDNAFPRPFKAFFRGLIVNLVAPLVIGIIAVTVVGIPLAVIAGLIWFVILSFSGPFAGYYLGRLIMPKNKNILLTMFVGGTLLLVLYFIPFIGIMALFFAGSTGTGMILLEIEKRTPKPNYKSK